jgi:hypothetical protein
MQTDLNNITSVETLESMAYKQIRFLNQTQTNIQLIEQRIAQLQEQSDKQPEEAVTIADVIESED